MITIKDGNIIKSEFNDELKELRDISKNGAFMIKEIENLLKCGADRDFLMSLGLEAKFVILYLEGCFETYDDFFEELFKEERHFAKRQQTWFNKEKNLIWLEPDDNLLKNAIEVVENFLNS